MTLKYITSICCDSILSFIEILFLTVFNVNTLSYSSTNYQEKMFQSQHILACVQLPLPSEKWRGGCTQAKHIHVFQEITGN